MVPRGWGMGKKDFTQKGMLKKIKITSTTEILEHE